MPIIVLLGASGVGKDTLATALMNHLGEAVNFKVVAALKRKWEEKLSLPHGALELRSVKSKPIPPQYDYTYGQWMIDEFNKSKGNPNYRHPLIDRMGSEISWYCDNNVIPICTDIRMPDEIELLATIGDCYHVLSYLLERTGVKPLDSDKYLNQNIDTLARNGYPVTRLQIDGTAEQWLTQIAQDVEYLRQ